uniref:Nucleoporin Nup54 alpha-helical domain-containing protein n=1 Tax=Globisporangium ultimum (strain ATCC 200006 / CBS 805.95 / DAOM BR144) TaxID=431595 RepID=K3WSE2_GLOUD
MKRIQVQQEHAGKYNNYTNDLRSQLKEMEKTTRATEEKLERCRHEHVQLFHSLVKVMKDIEFLQNAGKPLQRNEMQLVMALKKLQTLLDSPAQYKARLNDAVSLQRIQDAATPAPPANQLSPEDLQRIFQFLDKQRQGLEHLTNILNEDLAAIKFIKESWRR